MPNPRLIPKVHSSCPVSSLYFIFLRGYSIWAKICGILFLRSRPPQNLAVRVTPISTEEIQDVSRKQTLFLLKHSLKMADSITEKSLVSRYNMPSRMYGLTYPRASAYLRPSGRSFPRKKSTASQNTEPFQLPISSRNLSQEIYIAWNASI